MTLHCKKPKMARAAYRVMETWLPWRAMWPDEVARLRCIYRWHRAVKP